MATTARPSSSSNRREAISNLTRLYFDQLTKGCKNKSCQNRYCATGSGKPLPHTEAGVAAVKYAMGLKTDKLCESIDINRVCKSPTPIIDTNAHNSPSTSGITGGSTSGITSSSTSGITGGSTSGITGGSTSEITGGSTSRVTGGNSSKLPSRRTPEPMDTNDTVRPDPSVPVTLSESFTEASSSFEQIGNAASSTLILDASVEDELQPASSAEEIPPSTSEDSYDGPVVTATSSSDMDTTTTSDSISLSSIDVDSTTTPPKIKFSGSALFKSLGPNDMPYLDEAVIQQCILKAEQKGDTNFRDLSTKIWIVFSSFECLNRSFILPESEQSEVSKKTGISVDLKAVRRAYDTMFELALDRVKNTMGNAIDMYRNTIKMSPNEVGRSLNHLVLLLENPLLHSPEFLKPFPKILQTVASLSASDTGVLIEWYSHYSTEELLHFVSSLQQLVTIQLLSSDESEHTRHYIPQSDSAVTAASSALAVFYFANLVKAKREGKMKPFTPSLMSIAATVKAEFMHDKETMYEQLLSKFQVHPALLEFPPIDLSEFVNEELNDRVNMMLDYHRDSRDPIERSEFSFIRIPFVLTTANKMEKLIRDNLVNMYSERHRSVIHSILTGVPDIPFLLLRISRDNIVSDALVQLEAISDLNPIDLRKQLRVDFRGEEGIDEGGLQKEFFQLLVEKLFDPMHGMFLFDESTRQHWFNPFSFEGEQQYRLIGILLGLAIYNNVILDIRFPMVIYQKLIGCPTTFDDLYSSHPQIASSLKSMTEFEGSDEEFEDTFLATFKVSFSDLFGTVQTHSLKGDGDETPVTKTNCQEYVDLYTQWLLNGSIATSFDAFKRGFDLVMKHSNLADLFTAEEVEMLICGCNEWDIDALEESTRYDGFTPSHPVIVNFWQIVREYSEEQKKQLLAFITGSDRIPVGGLAKLKLVIVKNGPDSNRIPTAHTCFNALMLCEYSSKERLKKTLTIAISYAKGFGMI